MARITMAISHKMQSFIEMMKTSFLLAKESLNLRQLPLCLKLSLLSCFGSIPACSQKEKYTVISTTQHTDTKQDDSP